MSDLQSKVTWPWDTDEAGCQEPSHNLGESRPVMKAATKGSGITDRAESLVTSTRYLTSPHMN